MIDPGNSRHDSDRDLDVSHLLTFEKVVYRGKILPDGILNILEGLFFGLSLRPPVTRRTEVPRYSEVPVKPLPFRTSR